jgi:uncharacterized protein (TIGR00255 family)
MPLTSMTGFGRGTAATRGIVVEVELSSVNRRQFDVRVGLPKSLLVHEPRMNAMIHTLVERGQVTGTVKMSLSSRARRLVIDGATARAYVKTLRRTAQALKLDDDLGAGHLLALPEVLHYEDIADDSERMWPILEKALRQALNELVGMRNAEGAALERDLRRRFRNLRRYLNGIKRQAPTVTRRYADNLRSRLQQAGLKLGADAPELQRELALFADRCDVSEEIVRMESHFRQADKLMAARKSPGRALDFLCQEMFREINTIGSKANDAAISRHVVRFKTELECIREQAQNVE